MSDIEKIFIRDICESPDDDSLRLIYADWLEDAGRLTLPGFIRAQIDMARNPGDAESRRRVNVLWNARSEDGWEIRMDRELSSRHPFLGQCDDIEFGSTFMMDFVGASKRKVVWRRGFPELVVLSMQEFLDCAQALFGRYPIKEVSLNDREPSEIRYVDGSSPGWRWYAPAEPTRLTVESFWPDLSQSLLTRELFYAVYRDRPGGDYLFGSAQEAMAGLASGCLHLGLTSAGINRRSGAAHV